MNAAEYQKALNEILFYEAETGNLIWKERPMEAFTGANPLRDFNGWNKKYKGKVAGHTDKSTGYTKVGFGGNKTILAHRAIWVMMYGEYPNYIDHINGDRSDNRLENIRSVTRSQNQANRPVQSNNKTGYKGVSKLSAGCFSATIQGPEGRRYLGYFPTAELAHEAYVKAAEDLWGEYACKDYSRRSFTNAVNE